MMRPRSRMVFLIFLAILLVGFGYLMRSFWVAAALALITAMLLRPVHARIERTCRHRRYLAAALSVVLTGSCVILPLASIVATILLEMVRFSREIIPTLQEGQLAQSLDAMNAWLLGFLGPMREWLGEEWNVRDLLVAAAQNGGRILYSYSPRFLLSTAHFGVNVILWTLFLFVLFAEGPALYRYVMMMTPISPHHERYIAREVRGMVAAVFFAMIATSAANAVLISLAFLVCGIERPVMWGLIAFGFSFVPVIGALSIWGGAAVYLLLVGAWPSAVGLALFGVLIISQTDNVIKPLVMRGRVNIHPMLLLLSILGGVQTMGPVGLIFGPVFLAIFLAALHIYRQEFVEPATAA
ncbi:MAG: AI-2E family transporter [Deltaproteobacteria bacterium]|nr:AI-2E family transporter [Deltaproteobacteria bacterium]